MNKLNVVNEYSGISARAKPPLLSMRENFHLTPAYARLPSAPTDSGGGGEETMGAIHSTKISGNFGPKLNGSVRSNRKSFEKTGPPFEVVLFSRSDRSDFWLNGSRPKLGRGRIQDMHLAFF